MKKFLATGMFTMASVALLGAQGGTGAKPPAQTLKIDVVLSRTLADKKVSNLPFTLWITTTENPGGTCQSIRVGVDVPIGTSMVTKGSSTGSGNTQTSSTTSAHVDYRNIGTSIDGCVRQSQSLTVDSNFLIDMRVSDSSVFGTGDTNTPAALKNLDASAFRTFSMNNVMKMRDGQTSNFATATDKLTGETLKVDVTVTVIK